MPVVDRATRETLLLTASHVVGGLARAWRVNVDVYSFDGLAAPATQRRIGNTIKSVPDAMVDRCDVDGALARLADGVEVTRNLDRGSIVRQVRHLSANDIGLAVHKRGAATGETTGEFYEISTDVPLRVRSRKNVLYSEVLAFASRRAPFAQPGDSGAVVVDDAMYVIGLIVGMEQGAPDPLVFAVPIQPLLDALDVDL
jgi:Trypsin